MHINDLDLLMKLRDFFGVGTVYLSRNTASAQYQVSGINNLLVLLNHFKNYPLQSSKRHSFFIFNIILDLMAKKEHLTKAGLLKVISYINLLNKPLNKESLAKIIKILGPLPFLALPPVPIITSLEIIHPYWIVGFIMGDGGFTFTKSVATSKKTHETRVYFSLQMFVCQLKMDAYLLRSIANHIGVGLVNTEYNSPMAQLVISNAKAIQHLLLPFFSKYPLLGHKRIQYDLWLKAVLIIFGESKYSKERQNSLILVLMELSELQSRAQDKRFLSKFLST